MVMIIPHFPIFCPKPPPLLIFHEQEISTLCEAVAPLTTQQKSADNQGNRSHNKTHIPLQSDYI